MTFLNNMASREELRCNLKGLSNISGVFPGPGLNYDHMISFVSSLQDFLLHRHMLDLEKKIDCSKYKLNPIIEVMFFVQPYVHVFLLCLLLYLCNKNKHFSKSVCFFLQLTQNNFELFGSLCHASEGVYMLKVTSATTIWAKLEAAHPFNIYTSHF